jgi:hypothetical protein
MPQAQLHMYVQYEQPVVAHLVKMHYNRLAHNIKHYYPQPVTSQPETNACLQGTSGYQGLFATEAAILPYNK